MFSPAEPLHARLGEKLAVCRWDFLLSFELLAQESETLYGVVDFLGQIVDVCVSPVRRGYLPDGTGSFSLQGKLNPDPEREGSPIRADELDTDAIERMGFGRFLQIIPDTDWPSRILIAADPAAAELAQRRGCKNSEMLGWFVGRPRDYIDQIAVIEHQHGLDGAQRQVSLCHSLVLPGRSSHSSGDANLDEETLSRFDWQSSEAILYSMDPIPKHSAGPICSYILIHYPAPANYLGFYTEEVVYQRKRMNAGFYQASGSPFLHWHRADVEQAMTYLDLESWSDPEMSREIKEHYQANFLDNFEEGQSVFSGSY